MREASHVEGFFPNVSKVTVVILFFVNKLTQYIFLSQDLYKSQNCICYPNFAAKILVAKI